MPATKKGGKISKSSKAKFGTKGGAKVAPKRKIKLFEKNESLQLYIYKMLKHDKSDVGIKKKAMTCMNSILLDVYRKISREAAQMSRLHKK